jgi:hypothetical protein
LKKKYRYTLKQMRFGKYSDGPKMLMDGVFSREFFTLFGACLLIASMTTTYYKNAGVSYSVFGHNGASCLGASCGACEAPEQSPTCKTVKSFSVMGAIFSVGALLVMVGAPKFLHLDNLVSKVPFNMGDAIGDVLGSEVGLLVAALVCTFVYFMTAILAGSEARDGFLDENRSLVEMSNTGTNSVELTDGFHMSWAAMLCLIIAVILAAFDCVSFNELFKQMW